MTSWELHARSSFRAVFTHKTKTRVITLASHYMNKSSNTWKHMWPSQDWFRFHLWVVEKVEQNLLTNQWTKQSETNESKCKLHSTLSWKPLYFSLKLGWAGWQINVLNSWSHKAWTELFYNMLLHWAKNIPVWCFHSFNNPGRKIAQDLVEDLTGSCRILFKIL